MHHWVASFTIGSVMLLACGSSPTATGSPSGSASSKVVGPESCASPCEACAPIVCACADGISVRGCACNDTGTCGDVTICANGHACIDHGGNAKASSPPDAETQPDAGTKCTPYVSSTDNCDSPCPHAFSNGNPDNASALCTLSCASAQDCPSAYDCDVLGVCVPTCSGSDTDCPSGMKCPTVPPYPAKCYFP